MLLIGGGALLFLVLVGLVLAWVLTRRTGDDMVAQANEYYHASSFTKAIDAYSQYLEKYPSHKDAGVARVRLSLSRMRQATQGGDWPNALKVAGREIQAISGEETFATEARPELAAMLPEIAEGLAKKAQADQDPALADLADESLALIEKYLPSSARPQTRLEDIESLIALTRARSPGRPPPRDRGRDPQGSRGRTQEGYQLRAGCSKVSCSSTTPASRKRSKSVSQAEQTVVERSTGPGEPGRRTGIEAAGDGRAGAADRRCSFHGRRPARLRRCRRRAYGSTPPMGRCCGEEISASRRASARSDVRRLQPPTSPAIRYWSAGRQEVLRVAAATGLVRWRFPLGGPFDAHRSSSGPGARRHAVRAAGVDRPGERRSSGYVQLPQAAGGSAGSRRGERSTRSASIRASSCSPRRTAVAGRWSTWATITGARGHAARPRRPLPGRGRERRGE